MWFKAHAIQQTNFYLLVCKHTIEHPYIIDHIQHPYQNIDIEFFLPHHCPNFASFQLETYSSLYSFTTANQKSVRYSVSMSCFTNI